MDWSSYVMRSMKRAEERRQIQRFEENCRRSRYRKRAIDDDKNIQDMRFQIKERHFVYPGSELKAICESCTVIGRHPEGSTCPTISSKKNEKPSVLTEFLNTIRIVARTCCGTPDDDIDPGDFRDFQASRFRGRGEY